VFSKNKGKREYNKRERENQKMKKNTLIIVIALIAILAVSAIYVVYSTQNPSQQSEGITITDSEGYQTTLTSVPQRIVSLAPSVTPILYEIGVGDKVVGVTEYDDYPYDFSAWFEAGNMTNMGGFSTPNNEAIINVDPDVIFTTNINDPSLSNWRDLGFKVIVVGPTSIQGIYDTINLIGKATGAENNANTLVDSLKNQISEVTQTIAAANIEDKPKVYYEIWYDTTGIMSAGSGSWINDVISAAGGVNIFADNSQEYPNTNSEEILYKNPTVILLPSNMGTGTPFYGSVDDVKARPGWNAIDAIQNDRIYVIDQNVFGEPGARVADQVQAVAECLYPQLFNSPS
jgi:iron complex transport system substrate-binding protein